MADVKLTGLSDLQATMQLLQKRLQTQIARKAMNRGAAVLKKEIKRRTPQLEKPVPHRTRGTVKKNIRSKTRRQRDGKVKTRVWVKSLPGKKVAAFKAQTGKSSALDPNNPWYWWLVEFGTSKMPAKPFMRPGFEAKKHEATRTIVNSLKHDIEKAGR